MKMVIKLVMTMLIVTVSINAKESSPAMIIDEMIKEYGGEKNIKQLNSYEQVWHIETMMSDKNGTDNRMVLMPDLLRTELIYPDKTEIRSLVRDYGTKQYGERMIQAQGPMLDAMKLQLMRLYNPLVLKTKLKDTTILPDEKYYILSVNINGLVAKYFVSKKSYLIEKVIGKLTMGNQSMEFKTLYQNYKYVKGVMMPHKEIKYAGSANTAIMRLQTTTFMAPPSRHR